LTVRKGERIALTGANGSGKSTVLKVLAGIFRSDADISATAVAGVNAVATSVTGTVRTPGGLIVSYVPQDASFLSGDLKSFAESAGADRTLITTILRNLGFERADLDGDLNGLSEGQKKKVLLAKSLSESAHLYLWDEPLNYIDVISRAQIEDVLLTSRPTLVFIEHDQVFAEKIATRTADIRR
jgi:lincosamide and streptogramin A transport system ATP-binding/permease protein